MSPRVPSTVVGPRLTFTLPNGASMAYRDTAQSAPDLRGHGRGIRPWPKFSIEECADHIMALADSLGIDRFIACGYSMGSLVAQQMWRRHASPKLFAEKLLDACEAVTATGISGQGDRRGP